MPGLALAEGGKLRPRGWPRLAVSLPVVASSIRVPRLQLPIPSLLMCVSAVAVLSSSRSLCVGFDFSGRGTAKHILLSYQIGGTVKMRPGPTKGHRFGQATILQA